MKKEKLLKILLAPHLSEKTAAISGQYVFQVAKSANKLDIKAAVEELFKVTVKAVNVINIKGANAIKMGRKTGRYASWKKAYVVLNAGQEIQLS
ncbi:MAG: 50S ribosomal protein L23 [Gammaproteobacteria bacterium RIFCSPHIGHO2_12_FULL_38_11]|nr:MAG: 50S ribosomal protein L23 [Gammaproteobacteria bacterium RIFCSPHIGHO2_12_FULL_38_11]